jgi:hypothetical protein
MAMMKESRVAVDGSAVVGLGVFAFTYLAILFVNAHILAHSPASGETEAQGGALFGLYEALLFLASLVALGSHAAGLAWTRRRFRRLRPSLLLGLEVLIAAVSAGLTLLADPSTVGIPGGFLILLFGPANVTVAIYAAVDAIRSRRV